MIGRMNSLYNSTHVCTSPHRFAFGITLWELYTSQRAFRDVNRAFLGYQISKAGLRPEFSRDAPADYATLAEACWQEEAALR